MNVNLVLLKKNGTTKAFALSQGVTVIGRQVHCDLCVPLSVVSRKHCELNQDKDVLRVRDMGSRNGTLVNGKKVAEGVLSAGDKLQIGPVTFAVQIDGRPETFSPSESDIRRVPAELDETSKGGEEDDLLDAELETMHQGKAKNEDEDDEAGEFFDEFLEGLEGEAKGKPGE